MKRFYKFLMPLVAIVALALPVSVTAQTTCQIKIVGEDAYADGWNGGSLAVVQGGTTVATFDAANADNDGSGPELDSTLVTVNAAAVQFVWTSGSYDDEVTIWIYASDGTLLFTVTEPSAGTIFSMGNACSTNPCLNPTGFAVNAHGDTAEFSWTAGSATAWEIVWGATGFVPDNETTNIDYPTNSTYELTGLADGFYEAYLRTDCGTEYSGWVGPVMFSVGATIMNMATSGSDTLRSCSAIVYDNGGPTATYSANCQATLVIFPSDNFHAVKISGTSETEGSYDYLTIYSGVGIGGDMLFRDNTSGDNSVHTFGPFLSTDAFTVVFHSDGSVQKNGFQINVECEDLPSCLVPESFVLGDIDSGSVSFHWTDNAASAWTIGYGPTGFTLGDTNTMWADFNDTLGTVTGLNPNTVYDFYLMAVCGGDSSWTRSLTVRTACAPIHSLPYVQNFNSCPTGSSVLFDPCWSIFSTYSSAAYWPYASSGYLYMYMYDGSANIDSQHGYALLPPLSSDISDDDLELTFDLWKSSSTGYGNGVIVALFDVANNPVDTLAIIIPTATSQATAETQYVLVPIDSLEGKRIGFWYQNQDPVGSGSYYYYAYIDNVDLHVAPSCSHVVNLQVPAVTAGSAYVTWNPGPAGEYSGAVVEYRDTAAGSTWNTLNTTDNFIAINGLDSNTYYEVRVAAVCGSDAAQYEYTSFHTVAFGCIYDPDSLINVTIGNGTTTDSYIPSYSLYNYSYTQQFYTAREMGGSGSITSVTLTPSAITNQRTYEIYMGQSADSSASSFVTPAGLTCVYNGGPVNLVANQPVTFEFTTPFNYVDTSNLVIIFRDMTGSWSSGNSWYGHTAWTNASRYVYQDGGAYTVPQTSGGSSSSFRNNITFFGGVCMGISSCSAPAAWVTGVSRDSVYLEWIPGATETSWDVYYELGDSLVLLGTANSPSFEASGLSASTDYTFHIVASCGSELHEATVSATTSPDDAYSILPFVCTFDSLDGVWLRAGEGQTNKWYIGTVDSNRVLMISDNNGTSNTYTISATSASHAYARLVLPAGEYAYSFDWMAQGESSYDYILAYVVPDSYTPVAGSYGIPGNAIRIDGGNYLNQHNTWQTRSDVFTIADSGVYKMVFTWRNDGSGGSNPPAVIDNVYLALNTCPRPSNIVVDTVTTNSVTFHWTDTNSSTTGGYVVEYNGFVDQTMNTSYTATGLNASTNYTFRVYSVCSGNDTSVAQTVSVFTACGDVPIPYNEGFEAYAASTSAFPVCWTNFSNSSNYIQASYGVGSSNALHFAGPGVVVTPRVPLQGNRIVLSCWLRAESTTSSGSMHIGFTTNPATLSDYVEIMEIAPNTTLTHYTDIYFDSASIDTGYVVFKQDPSASSIYYWWLDDINIVDMGNCPRPNNLSATNATTTTVDLSWSDRGTPSSWIIEYGPMGFTLGTGTQVAASSNPFTLTGVTSSYMGDFYVRAICGAGDTSDFSTAPGHFATTQVPATLPYNYDFENPAEWANWQTSCNSTVYNWYRGTNVADSGSYSMYVASSDSTYYGYSFDAVVNAAAYRDVDFGPIDSSYTFTFRARAGGTTTNYYDGLMVFLVDPAIPTIASESGITSPWGNVNDLYRIATMRLDTTWQTYEASFDTISGIHRVAFFWFNQNTGASYANIPQPAAVDNIHIAYATCPRPVDLEVVNVTDVSATLTWTAEAGANYEIAYREVGGTNQFITATTNSVTIGGLTPNGDYRAWVRKLCGVGDTSLWSDGVAFNTALCAGGTEATNFDPTASATTSSYSPIGYATYNYSYVQTIIDSADLASLGGDITAFAFLPTNTTSSDYYTNITMYMANVSESDVANSFIMPDATHVFTKVIDSANFNFTTTDWQIHNLDTAFTWDGHSNLLIAVNREHGSWSSSTSFSAHTASVAKMRYVYQDSGPYNINTVSGGYSSTAVGDIRLISCASSCAAPAVVSIQNDYQSATITVAGGSDYDLVYGTDIAAMGDTMNNSTGIFNISGLMPATTYFFGVRQHCDSVTVSNWYQGSFTTDSLPCFVPENVTVEATTFNSATISWSSNATAWELHVVGAGLDSVYAATTNPFVIGGLYQGTQYNVSVRSICMAGVEESEYSAPITFTTNACNMPEGVTVSNVTYQSADVSWQAVSGALGYNVYWGDPQFIFAQVTPVPVTGTSYTITGLEAESPYEVVVVTRCTESLEASPTANDRIGFTTGQAGIYDVENGTLTLYPNPATTSVSVNVTGMSGNVTLQIVDMNGRTVYSQSGSNEFKIDVSSLAQGAYFVRVTSEQQTAVRKLIVK